MKYVIISIKQKVIDTHLVLLLCRKPVRTESKMEDGNQKSESEVGTQKSDLGSRNIEVGT